MTSQVVESLRPTRRALRLLWAGQTVSLLGDQMTMLALPLAALGVGASPTQVALLVGASHAPFLLFGLPAGVWVARVGLRRSMIFADTVRAVALMSVPIAVWVGTLTYLHLVLAAVTMGCGAVLFMVAYQSLTPLLVVDAAAVRSANSRLTASEAITLVVGPAIAGLLVGALGAVRTLALDALSYLVSAGHPVCPARSRGRPARSDPRHLPRGGRTRRSPLRPGQPRSARRHVVKRRLQLRDGRL